MFQGGNRPVKLGSYQIDEAGSLGFDPRRNNGGWVEQIHPVTNPTQATKPETREVLL